METQQGKGGKTAQWPASDTYIHKASKDWSQQGPGAPLTGTIPNTKVAREMYLPI